MQRKREEQEEVGTRREERQIDPPIEEKSNTNYRLSRTGGGKLREATREVCDTSLFSAAHTKAAYYLILHTTDRGIGTVRKAERKQRHTVDARKGEGAIVIIARVAFCWQEHKASLC